MGVGAENYVEGEQYKNKDSTTHFVTLSSYEISETAVTQGLWKAVMGTDVEDLVAVSPYPTATPKKGDAYPISYVRLSDAIAFIDRLNQLTGLNFRLPTEAEWEYAARGGNKSRGFSYSGSDDSKEVASSYGSRVAQKKPNELGIYDMSGCTREMCIDIWKDKYIYDSHVVNPVGPIQTSGNRVLRGGYCFGPVSHPYSRAHYTPTWCGSSMGFRLVLPTDQQRRMIYVSDTTYYTENDTLKTRVLYSYFEMVYVEGGTFMMGAATDDADAEADEKPQHQVTLSDYYIGQVEVTQQLWNTVLGTANNPSSRKGNNLPVNNVTYADCQRFIARLNELTGLRFRLPTEAEWEYAARGGKRSNGYKYSGSNDVNEVAWTSDNSGNKTHDVGTKLPNELGVFDMSGNVWEYCQDWYGAYNDLTQINPMGPESGTYLVCRGGGYEAQKPSGPMFCRTTSRGIAWENEKYGHVGLRLVLEVDTYVDLGLSVEWATCNVGANNAWEVGDYFAWGETEPKETYTWANYKWAATNYDELTKYCSKVEFGHDGFTDDKIILDSADDAAHVNLGGKWRMPSEQEWKELIEKCTWTWTVQNGVVGYQVTSKINGNSIFLPITGSILKNNLTAADTHGYYWLNSISTTYPYNAYDAYFNATNVATNAFSRYIGRPIRPVRSK